MPVSSKEFLDIQATIEDRFTLKCIHDMVLYVYDIYMIYIYIYIFVDIYTYIYVYIYIYIYTYIKVEQNGMGDHNY